MQMKILKITAVAYEMLAEIAKKSRLKPEKYIEHLIHIKYRDIK